MKKYFIALLLSLGFLNLFAQKSLQSGTLQYDITITSARPNANINNLQGSTLQVQLSPTQSRTDMASTLGAESTVFDSKAGKGFILKEYSGQKLMITTTRANWTEKNQGNDALDFKSEAEKTTVNGYECIKAVATGPEGKKITVYYTPSIIVANSTYNGSFKSLPGLPVKYEVTNGNLTFVYNLSSVNFDVVPQSKFAAPTQGYRVMTYDENQELQVRN